MGTAVTEPLGWILAVAAGAGLGAFYFGGLWWTLGRILDSLSPASEPKVPFGLALGSFVVRTVITLAGFYLVANGDWIRLLLCLAGFLLARTVLVRRWGPRALK